MEGLSVSDAIALMDERRDGAFGGDSFWWFILLIIFGGNGNFFGGNNLQLSQLERDVLNGTCATQKEVLESRYTTQLGFQNLSSELASCCCDLKTAIHAEGEATRGLIQANTIQDLRDRLALANNTISEQAISQNIVNQIRPVPVPAYLTCSPYTSYNVGNFGYAGCNYQNI